MRHPLANRRTAAFAVSVLSKMLIPALGLWPGHWIASAVLFFAPDVWIWAGLLVPNAGWLIPTATRFATRSREVWLTIDDGPDPATTRRMLDLLDRHSARATFFVVGTRAASHPDLVAEILRRGHSLGNHTLTHPMATFWLAGPGRTRREIDGCQAALDGIGASSVAFFRPPVGIRTFFLHGALAERGLVNVGWTARGRERFSASEDAPLRRLKRGIRPGAILLLHESQGRAGLHLALLERLLEHLSGDGYACVIPDRGAVSGKGP